MMICEFTETVRRHWWKCLAVAFATSITVLLVTLRMPDLYRAEGVIAPAADEEKLPSTLGILASSIGVPFGVPNKVEDLDALFKSNDLTVRIFRKYNLWPIFYRERFDPATGKITTSLLDRLKGEKNASRAPNDWDAIRAAEDFLRVAVNTKKGLLSVIVETEDPESSKAIVGYYLEEAKSRLQEEAFDRASKNKKFLMDQVGKTVDALTRDRVFALYGQEVEREMLAKNREQFGFRVIDSPRATDRRSKPYRITASLLSFFIVLFAAGLVFFLRDVARDQGTQAIEGR